MIGIYAKAIIAMVKNAKTVMDGSVFENPRKPMSANVCLAPMSSYGKMSISLYCGSSPDPAAISLFDLLPEMFFGWWNRNHIGIKASLATKPTFSFHEAMGCGRKYTCALLAGYKNSFLGLLSFLRDCRIIGRHMDLLNRFMCLGCRRAINSFAAVSIFITTIMQSQGGML
jgi:hypothetical protein